MTTEQRRKANRECVVCCKPLGDFPHIRCPVCLEIWRDFGAGRYYQLREAHKCTQCGRKMPDDYFYVRCEECRTRDRRKEREKHGTVAERVE